MAEKQEGGRLFGSRVNSTKHINKPLIYFPTSLRSSQSRPINASQIMRTVR